MAACLGTTTAADADDHSPFTGWQGLRVIEQDGYPGRLRTADLDGDGRDEIIVVNPRNARLDLFTWNDGHADADDTNSGGGGGHINDLPMARELALTEVPVRQPPIDMAVQELDGVDGQEMYVLTSEPNRLLRLTKPEDKEKWATADQWDLLPARYAGIHRLLQFVPDADGDTVTVLVSCFEGIQELVLATGNDPGAKQRNRRARATWLEPRESNGRIDWWQADLNGDGRDDLVEWTGNSSQSLRWYPGSTRGYRPAQTLHDRGVNMVALLENDGSDSEADELLVLESNPEGVVRRYRLAEGEASDLGKQEPLALAGGDAALWSVTEVDGEPTLVVLDPGQPRVTLYTHDAAGWSPGESYPVIANVKAMEPLPATEDRTGGALLLWPDDGGDLYRTAWADGRLSFPQPIGLADDVDESLILALGRVGQTVWCVQKADEDLLLHRWVPGEDGASVTTFTGAAGKAERALWLGDGGLLVADKFAKGLRLVAAGAEGEDAADSEPPHLAKAKLDEFRLFDTGENHLTLARFTDGVMQWLDLSLYAQDQVMLPDGQRLADLVLNGDGSAWALQQGGGAIHKLVPDDAGVLRVESTTRVDDGRRLAYEPGLGMLMVTGQGVTRLAEGKPWELEVVQSLDARDGRPAGVDDATVHRVMALDLDGDGRDDALLADDIRHQLTALGMDDGAGELTPMISWPVFEDQTYPYGGSGEEQVREPRAVATLDVDGDGGQDLVMISHDRLVIYLAHEPQTHASEEQHDAE